MEKDKKGLYYLGIFQTDSYTTAIKKIYELSEVPNGFCVDANYNATGYSVVDCNGVQHIYELNPTKFYDALMKLD